MKKPMAVSSGVFSRFTARVNGRDELSLENEQCLETHALRRQGQEFVNIRGRLMCLFFFVLILVRLWQANVLGVDTRIRCLPVSRNTRKLMC